MALNELPSIRRILDERHSDWQIGALRPIGRGMGMTVYQCLTGALGPVAIRVPRLRWFENDNDGRVDARDLLTQEAKLTAHMGSAGLPSPVVHAVEFSDEIDLLITSYMESDGSIVNDESLGELTARVHAAPLYSGRLVEQGTGDFATVISTRVSRRAAALSQRTGSPIALPPIERLRGLIEDNTGSVVTLHMDMRPENVIARGRTPIALVDWDNALRGPAALEFARVAEYGHLSSAFIRGYKRVNEWAETSAVAEVIFRLDTAIMLANVFVSEAPDPPRAARQIDHVNQLLSDLSELS